MALYKIRAWVNERTQKGFIEHPYTYDEIVLHNKKTACSLFQKQVSELKTWQYSIYSGKAEVFVPHVFEDGTLAYWPDDDNYICKFEFGDV